MLGGAKFAKPKQKQGFFQVREIFLWGIGCLYQKKKKIFCKKRLNWGLKDVMNDTKTNRDVIKEKWYITYYDLFMLSQLFCKFAFLLCN